MQLLINSSIINILPILKLNLYRTELSFVVQTYIFKKILNIFKNHISYQFKILTCISGVDYPNNLFRFSLVYELLSLKFNSRIRLKIMLDEITPMDSIENIMPCAYWWECEIWDMFGVFFLGEHETIRLLTDYGFHGHPLRKDFPLSGHLELKYNSIKNKVMYENVELAQEYRTFDFISPWGDTPKL
jgi:NADH-quinone oxidoreductase subunit C